MPQVGNRKFAYTAAGIRQAMKAAKNMKKRQPGEGRFPSGPVRPRPFPRPGGRPGPSLSGRPLPRPMPGNMRPNFPGQLKERRQSVMEQSLRPAVMPTGDRMYRPSDGPKTPGQNIKGPGIPNIRRPRPIKGQGIPNIRFPRG